MLGFSVVKTCELSKLQRKSKYQEKIIKLLIDNLDMNNDLKQIIRKGIEKCTSTL
ncbi:MAG: hypothetical protein UR84_C0022G0007 [candidate division WS6 bacterium GW2011_GWD1_35_594]|nr:MAG: hypothetical protein UR43_C0027G0005 [candidate division TM6 bacterium GW2011_GWF2_33_332]KKP81560.1 MAG: hypothetical protein UR84_C0022G0007 [candidate division WS6 bacterium GW2011_GWD1_35_594]